MKKEEYMRRALELAAEGAGFVNPNPQVGALVVKDSEIIAEGYHEKYGSHHAEVNALLAAGERARGAELFVNLEPCSHYGKTPPCALRIIESGIKKVYIAMRDPNPLVAGRGIKLLREAGIEVKVGLLEGEAVRLNEVFIKFITEKRPFITMKAAQSLDGKTGLAGRSRVQITGPESLAEAHRLRNRNMAIMVGSGTIEADDPQLTARGGEYRQPIRIILDTRAEIPPTARIFQGLDTKPTIIVCGESAAIENIRRLEKVGAEVVRLPETDGRPSVKALVEYLGTRQIDSVLLEGGGRLSFSFLEAGLVDKLILFIAPLLIGGESAPTPLDGKGFLAVEELIQTSEPVIERRGRDLMLTVYPQRR